MAGIIYYVADLETTGVSSKIHEITEVSIIRCSDRVQLTEMVRCEHPSSASYDALKLTHKTMADLLNGKSKEEVIDKIDKFLNEDGFPSNYKCIITHNTSFDKRFFHAFYNKVNKRFPADLWLCTMQMMKAYIKQSGVKSPAKLDNCCDLFGIKKMAGLHTAKGDTRNTYLLYKKLIDEIKFDYLPFIKNSPHLTSSDENEGLDPDLLD